MPYNMPNTISVRVPEKKKDALDKIAASLNRDRSWVINEAIDNYLDLYGWQVEHMRKAVKRADRRNALWHTSDKVRASFASAHGT
jgi:predicted transcriptional regulator